MVGEDVKKHTRSRREGVRRAEHGTASLDGVKTLPDHRNHGARCHVLDQAGEEGLALEVSVVYTRDLSIKFANRVYDAQGLTLLEVLGGSVDELEGNKLEATLLEAADDVADESTLDTVGL